MIRLLRVAPLALLLACTASLGLSACGSDSKPGAPDQFELVEATMADVHDALAGKKRMADGKKLTCVKLVDAYIDRILRYNNAPQPNGGLPIRGALYINPTALDQATALDTKYQQEGGVGDRYLHCMPVLLKDNFDTFDHPSTSGSYAMLGHQAGIDAESVKGLRTAGAVILGKANQDEFAFFTTGFSARAIQVGNPYNTAQSPGGSSSGTGASIAANFALGGTGSDTCMSIRLPSAVNGLVGIRPSLGVISQHGIFPLSHERDTGGPMVRTVRDAALMLTAMASVDPRDPKTLDFPESERPGNYVDYLDRESNGAAGKNIGVLRSFGNGTDADGEGVQAELLQAAVDKLKSLGANVYDVTLPKFQSRGASSTHWYMNDYFKFFDEGGGTSPRACVSSVLATPEHGRVAVCTANLPGFRGGIVESLRVGLRTAPAMLLAAGGDPDAAPTQEELDAIVDERKYVTAVMDGDPSVEGTVFDDRGNPVRLDALVLSPGPSGGRTCDLGSTTQMGSIVVPIGFDESVGVPRGMEIFVRRFDEGTGLGIAYDYEQATLHRKPPDISPGLLVESNDTIAEFNANTQKALMQAASVAPEDLPTGVYLDVLSTLTGTAPTP